MKQKLDINLELDSLKEQLQEDIISIFASREDSLNKLIYLLCDNVVIKVNELKTKITKNAKK